MTDTASRRRGHGEDAIYFDAAKNRFVGAISVGFGSGGKRVRRKVTGRTKAEVRHRLDEVPGDKPVYTCCRSGIRSYIAYCVLRQNGWDDVAFLAGGMMTYHGYHRTPLAVGTGGMPMVAHAEDQLAQCPGALEHI